jgi:hypothetical protein
MSEEGGMATSISPIWVKVFFNWVSDTALKYGFWWVKETGFYGTPIKVIFYDSSDFMYSKTADKSSVLSCG